MKREKLADYKPNRKRTSKAYAADFGCCVAHGGKMRGLWSYSTAVTDNAICQARRKVAGSICQKCYSVAMHKTYSSLNRKLVSNGETWKHEILSPDIMPIIDPTKVPYFRGEAFGDYETAIQVVNTFNLAAINPGVAFALWTKNPGILSLAIAQYGLEKPANLRIVYSSPMVNEAVPLERMQKFYPFIDSVFTVYDASFAAAHDITINCGAKSCYGCHKCYTETGAVINEAVKIIYK